MKFLNFAMPTFTSERVKMWLTQIMSSHPVPDAAFLECGGNDCDYDWKSICEGRCDYEHRHRVAPLDFKKNYEDMIHLLQEKGVAVTAVIAPPIAIEVYLSHLLKSGVGKDIMSEYVNSVQQMEDEFAEYGEIMRTVAKVNNCEMACIRMRRDMLSFVMILQNIFLRVHGDTHMRRFCIISGDYIER